MSGKKLEARARRSMKMRSRPVDNRSSLREAFDWFLADDSIFANCKFHGNVNWKPAQLAAQALCWCWQETQKVTAAFDYALEVCEDLGAKQIARTYPAFMNALTRYQDDLGACFNRRLQQLMEKVGGPFWRTDDWVLIGFDGSRTSTPRTVSNERAFCAPNYGKGKTAMYRRKKSRGLRRKRNTAENSAPPKPQIWITMFWHMTLQIAWSWRLGPSNSSEREHVQQMLRDENLPKNTLFCGDAGFVGYPLWSSILAVGGDFLVRVGGNVDLLSEATNFERQGKIVWCWPKDKQRQGLAPLKLRLLRVKIGKTKMWMLTSVLNADKLSARQIIRYYKMRWGIEVEFRGLKQTLDNDKLKSRTSSRALVELDWSLRATAVLKLLALREQMASRRARNSSYSPRQLSLAKTIRALRTCMRRPHITPPPGCDLWSKLAVAVVQKYNARTSKHARYRPPNPDKKPLGNPTIRRPTPKENQHLRTAA